MIFAVVTLLYTIAHGDSCTLTKTCFYCYCSSSRTVTFSSGAIHRLQVTIAASLTHVEIKSMLAYWHSSRPFVSAYAASTPDSSTPVRPWLIIRCLSRHELLYHSFMNMCSFIRYCALPTLLVQLTFTYIYILGQLPVSSVAPHLILPIIVNFNQRRRFLLMNRSHLRVESANVGDNAGCAAILRQKMQIASQKLIWLCSKLVSWCSMVINTEGYSAFFFCN